MALMRIASALVTSLVLLSSPAYAQHGAPNGNCEIRRSDACQAMVDIFGYLAPQLGALTAGGDATLGQGGALPGLGHVAVTIRMNALQASLPDVAGYTAGSTGQPQKIATRSVFFAAPAADVAVGVYGGYPLGVTKVAALDVLFNGSFLPAFSAASTNLELPNGSFNFGYGARLGLLQEGLLTPGLSLTWIRHDLPLMNIRARAANTTLNVDDIDVNSSSWRVVASKSLVAFSLAAGIGRDRYVSSATIYKFNGLPSTAIQFPVRQDVGQTSYFGDVSTNVLFAKAIAEIGAVSGGNIRTYDTFGGKPAGALRLYASLGVRVGI